MRFEEYLVYEYSLYKLSIQYIHKDLPVRYKIQSVILSLFLCISLSIYISLGTFVLNLKYDIKIQWGIISLN